MEFKSEGSVDHEIEIANLLIKGFSLNHISKIIGLSKPILTAHLKNMMEKLKAEDVSALIQILKEKAGLI